MTIMSWSYYEQLLYSVCSSGNRKVAVLIPGVEVSLSKTPNPNYSEQAGCCLAWLSVCECEVMESTLEKNSIGAVYG